MNSQKAEHSTLDDSNPGFGTWNGWYIAIVIFNICFVLLIAYLLSSV